MGKRWGRHVRERSPIVPVQRVRLAREVRHEEIPVSVPLDVPHGDARKRRDGRVVVDRLAGAGGVRCAAVAVHPENGVLLDASWNPDGPVCVVSPACAGRSRWRGGAALWERIDGEAAGPVVAGNARQPWRCLPMIPNLMIRA